MIAGTAIEETLRSIVGAEHIRSAGVDDLVCGIQPRIFVEPGSEQELAAALRCANDAKAYVIPRGGGTKLDWGNPPRIADLMVSAARLNRILEHAWADLTVTVEAGCTLQALQNTLAQHGQRLAVDPLWPERSTVGGILSTNDNGALRLRFGALRDLIIGVTLALPDGSLAHSGGKVVKNVAGYDLPKLATGALGTLGVITRAIFRLHPLPYHSITLSFAAQSLEEMQKQVLAIQDSKLAHTALQIRCGDGMHLEIDILFEATEAGLNAQARQLEKLIGKARAQEASAGNWNARQNLWDSRNENTSITKICMLPAEISEKVRFVKREAQSRDLQWKFVIQATGIGWLRLQGDPAKTRALIELIRKKVHPAGGSLVILHRPAGMDSLEAWGDAGDALPLMRALKSQLDPGSTLNPGRFVGGI